ncbi:MAG: hypothetical protein ABSA57_18135 [Candidatus Acidiferrales bacterium]
MAGTDVLFAAVTDLQKGVRGSGTRLVAVVEGQLGEGGMVALLVEVVEGHAGDHGTGAPIAAVAAGISERATPRSIFPTCTTDVPIVAGRAAERGMT